MTDQPPGWYPPPSAPSARTQTDYTSWFTRVVAWVIDYIPQLAIAGIGWALLLGTRTTTCVTDASEYQVGRFCETQFSTVGQLAAIFAGLIALLYVIWNLGYRQGTTGSSIGKSVMKFKVVSETTGQPIGFGLSCVRELLYLAASAACGLLWLIAVIFPLWDSKRQTLADKIMTTICLPT